jgi:hypothetical protein
MGWNHFCETQMKIIPRFFRWSKEKLVEEELEDSLIDLLEANLQSIFWRKKVEDLEERCTFLEKNRWKNPE